MRKQFFCGEYVKKKKLHTQILLLQHELDTRRNDYNTKFSALYDWITQHEKVCNTAEIHQVHQEIGEHLAKHATIERLHLQTKPIEVQPRAGARWPHTEILDR